MFSSRSSDFQLTSTQVNLLHSVVVFTLLTAAYAWSMPVSITLEDAGLFQMVCRYNGLAHPPGYPLFTLICPGFSQISWLDPVISGNMISALFAGLAGTTIFRLLLLVTKQRTSAYVAALGLGFSAAFWSQAIIIEVYALNIFLFCLLTLLLWHYSRTAQLRFLYWFVFVYGLGLSNHWPLVILSTPAFVLMLLPVNQQLRVALQTMKTLLIFGLLFLGGLLPYVTLLLKQDPFISLYGAVDGMSELFKYVSRSAYADGNATADWHDKIQYLVWLCREISLQFGWLANAVMLVGIVYARRYINGFWNLAFWAAFLGNTFLLMLLVNFDYSYKYTAMFKPYPLVSYTIMSVWLAFGFKFLTDGLFARWPWFRSGSLKTGLGLLIVVSVVLQNYQVNYRREDRLAEDHAGLVLSLVTPGANVFVLGDNEIGPVGFMHHVQGTRPDISLYAVGNVVFSNPLASPLASRTEQRERLLSFVASAGSSSYFLSHEVEIDGVDYGLFIEHRVDSKDGEQRKFVFDERITRFLEDILSRYEQQQITDPHSLIFVHNLLLGFSHQYIAYAFEHDPSDPLADDFLNRLLRLQNTFPGRLMTLDYVLRHTRQDRGSLVPKQLLLQMVAGGDASIPMETSVRNRAVFYEFAGHVALLDAEQYPSDLEVAKVLFSKSIENDPTADNPSFCQLMRIYQQQARSCPDGALPETGECEQKSELSKSVSVGKQGLAKELAPAIFESGHEQAQTAELRELRLMFPGAFESCISNVTGESP